MELFSKKQLRLLPTHVCGIYGLVYQGEVIYVGQSVNLKARIGKHYTISALQEAEKRVKANPTYAHQLALQRYQFIQLHKEQVYWVILAQCKVSELNRLEEKFISLYKPQYNYSGIVSAYKPVEHWMEDEEIVITDVLKDLQKDKQKQLLERI